MSSPELLYSTGDPVIDRVIRGYIAAFEAAFPGRLRCFVMAGGFAEGTATPLSDIDGGAVFRAPMPHDEWERANALIRACTDLARIHFDAGASPEDRLYGWRESGDRWASEFAVEQRYYCKLAYKIIWGEEFRDPILLPPIEYWARALFFGPHHMGSAPYFIGTARWPERANDPTDFVLTYPVSYPDSTDPFFGYARHPLAARDGATHLTTRMLVRSALAGAHAMVAWKARRFIASKADVAAVYREHIGGPWADLVEDVDRTCRLELRYLVPEDPDARRRLRALCDAMPAFENHILEHYRTFMEAEREAAASSSTIQAEGGQCIPVERAGWLLERSPDDVQALAASGDVPSAKIDGRLSISEPHCLARWAATMLDRVHFGRAASG